MVQIRFGSAVCLTGCSLRSGHPASSNHFFRIARRSGFFLEKCASRESITSRPSSLTYTCAVAVMEMSKRTQSLVNMTDNSTHFWRTLTLLCAVFAVSTITIAQTSTVVQKLGYPNDARLLVIQSDLAMMHSTDRAA